MWARFIALDILPVKQISKEVPSLLGDDGKTINSLLKTLLSNADDHVYKSYRSVRQASDINVDSFVRESEKRAEEVLSEIGRKGTWPVAAYSQKRSGLAD